MAISGVRVAGNAPELFGAASVEAWADSQLLERFIARREEAAFEALVMRHGPRVLGICRQVLGGSEDTEDAFQATFLVLVRKAGAIRERDSLGPWLYGVARRIAVRAKLRSVCRRTQEGRVVEMPVEQRSFDLDQVELRPVLDEEIGRLPEKYRLPIILCYLQEMTNEEAARRLQCPPGTLKSRLARAREILQGRLARRGVVLGAGMILWLSSTHAAATDFVPDSLIAATVKSSMLVAQGKLAAVSSHSPNVAAMVKDGLRSLFLAKVQRTSAAILVLMAIVGSSVVIASSTTGRSLVAGITLGASQGSLNLKNKTPAAIGGSCGQRPLISGLEAEEGR